MEGQEFNPYIFFIGISMKKKKVKKNGEKEIMAPRARFFVLIATASEGLSREFLVYTTCRQKSKYMDSKPLYFKLFRDVDFLGEGGV